LRPNHQTNPSVAVFCSSFNTPGVSVKKNGLFDQSRRYSPRSRNPSSLFEHLPANAAAQTIDLPNSPHRLLNAVHYESRHAVRNHFGHRSSARAASYRGKLLPEVQRPISKRVLSMQYL
jgi:hypothetical protein